MHAEIKQQFDDQLGIEPKDEVIQKAVELCLSYNVYDAVEFVEQWLAFSISHLNGAEPSIDKLQDFERKVYQVKRDKELAAAAANKLKSKSTKYPSALANLSHLNAAASAAEDNPLVMYGVVASDDMAADYGADGAADDHHQEMDSGRNACHTPKAKHSLNASRIRTPARQGDALFSPASYSPIGTPRSHLASQGSGKIVYTFGNPKIITADQWASLQPKKVQLQQLLVHHSGHNSTGETLNANRGKYMFDNLREKCDIAGDRLFCLGQDLCRKVFGPDAQDFELSQVDVHAQDTIKTIGVVACDHDGPLDATSTLLVGSDEIHCRSVRLNFTKTKSVALFPGQVVMVSGMNPKGDMFMVEEIYAERDLPPLMPPKNADQLSFVIAAGPYTQDDDLLYDPLQDLMAYLKDNKPDVLIMTGPFLEAEHKLIGDLTMAETFDSHFERLIAGVVEVLGSNTTILLVSSQLDANADPVYPTPPMTLKRTYPNVHLLPDPSMIDLNGIVVGVTSTDVVQHIVANELVVNGGDKVKRVVNYLLQQGSFYPLQPPAELEMCFDSHLANKFANIEQIPNILILPSSEKCFIRMVNGCLAINPGRLTDNAGGTFARLIITPPAPKEEANIFNYVACQVRKV